MKRQYTRINKEWHESNRMTKNPSVQERIKWHLAHEKHCACRPIPDKLKEEIKNKGKTQQDISS